VSEFRQERSRDGRVLEVLDSGSPEGFPVLFHYGTPSAATEYGLLTEAASARDVRLVIYSRPGYGGSSRRPDRTVAHCTEDVVDLADALGIARFATVGWSGGGPHALACAALLSDRVLAATTIAGVAPYPAEGLDWLAGMGEENVQEFGAALEGTQELVSFLERQMDDLIEVSAEEVADALGDLVPSVDRSSLTGEFAEFMAASFRKAVAGGIWGWFDDDRAFLWDWGFSLAEIRVPITVWQGRQDRMVPFAHGRWLVDHVPGARGRLSDEHGHLSLIASFGTILDDLLEGAGR
jgi:pimeloyl-ACP methyl ester carboxylesterase